MMISAQSTATPGHSDPHRLDRSRGKSYAAGCSRSTAALDLRRTWTVGWDICTCCFRNANDRSLRYAGVTGTNMTRSKAIRGRTVTVSPAVAAKVAESIARVGLTLEQGLAIAKAEPRGATIFAGKLNGGGKPVADKANRRAKFER